MVKSKLKIAITCARKTAGISCVLLVCNPFNLFAQTNDTNSVSLKEIEISGVANKTYNDSKKIQSIDSLNKQNFAAQSVADLLAVNTSLFVKNYGPAALSSVSLRGGNASQSPVLWNGFNIQNPMLGQNDFSQLPSFIFDEAAIEYGGSSALWGSGAMGGSIHLNNKTRFNKGFITTFNIGIGSFDTRKLNTRIHYSTSKFSTNTKVYFTHSQNNFEYKDTVIKKQLHADYSIKGLMQEVSFLFFKNQKINARAWYNQSFRNLPPLAGKSISKSSQTDENLKLSADWIYQSNKWTPSVRFAYFDDELNYTDSLLSLFSESRVKTLIGEADAKFKINNHHSFFLGYNYTGNKALTSNYLSNVKEFNKQAILAAYYLSILNNHLKYDLQLRQEFSDAFQIPFTGSTGFSYQLIKQLKLKISGAKVYRLPTLNDLYWVNGGNPDLKPEEGYTYEGGFEFKSVLNDFTLQSEMTYFNKNIYNWISWVPGPGAYPQAVNLMHVYSRGTETSSFISYSKNIFFCKIGFNSAYTLSTSQKSELANDDAVNKQLIYTPRYNYGGNFQCMIKNFALTYYHNYIGYRFTASDNSSWLEPYNVANIKVSNTFYINHLGVTAAFGINNVFNQNYFIVNQRPMPLRNYEVSITLNYHKPINTKKSS